MQSEELAAPRLKQQGVFKSENIELEYKCCVIRYFAELSRSQVESLAELFHLDLLLFGYSSQVTQANGPSLWGRYNSHAVKIKVLMFWS